MDDSWIRIIIKKNIVRVFLGSSASSLVKIIATIILSKIIAEKLGPNGLGLIGQLTSFVSITLLFASGGYQNGIVIFTAANKASGDLPGFIKPSLKLTLLISVFCGFILFLFAGLFSQFVFKSELYKYVFYWMGLTIVFYSFNVYFNSFLNGISDFKNFNFLNIYNSVLSLIVSAVLILWLGIKGALLAIVLSQTLTSLAIVRLLLKYKQFFEGFYKTVISKELLRKLLPYFKMTAFSLVLLPLSQIIIRNLILNSLGNFQMGIWEAVNRISGLYLMVISNVMLIYYLPRLSVVNKKDEIINEFKKGAFFFGAVISCIGFIIFLFRHLIIRLFLSASFAEVADYVLLQLVSDFFKVMYYLLAYFVIAKTLTLYYVITEFLFFCLYVTTAYFIIPVLGVKGALYANMIMNFSALALHMFFIGNMYFNRRNFITVFLFGNKQYQQ